MDARLLPYWLSIGLIVGLLATASGSLLWVEVNNAPEVYFPSDAPAVVIDRKVRAAFPQDQVLVALFEGDGLLSVEFLTALEAVVRQLSHNELVERVLTVTNVDHIRGSDGGFAVEPLLSSEHASRLSLAERRDRLLADRFAPGRLISRDGAAMGLVVRPRDLETSLQRLSLEGDVRDAIAVAGIASYLTGLTGNVPLDAAQLRSMVRDTLILVPGTTALGLVLIWWMFRRILAAAVTLLATSTISTATLGLLVATGSPLTLISAMIAPLMAALTIALLVHLFNALVYEASRGQVGAARVSRALASVRRPALYTALTTAAGLGALSVSSIQPIKQFGLATAVGVLVLYAFVVWLVPPLMLRWDRGDWPKPAMSGRMLDVIVSGACRLGIRHARWVLLACLVLVAIGIPQLWRVQAETDLYEFFRPEHPITVATNRVQETLSGVATVQVLLEGPGRDSLHDLGRLAVIDEFQSWLDEQPEVDITTSMVDLIEEMHWAFNEERPASRRLPEDQPLVSQYLLIYDGTDLYDLVNREFDRTLVAVNLNVRGANATADVIDRIHRYMHERDTTDLRYEVAGFGRLFADQEDLLISGQIHSLWSALGVIFLFMLVLFRSPRDALLCMLPNASPVLFIFVLMGVLGIWLDMATAMVASVAVGIAVDDTIHFYHGYKSRLAHGSRPLAALVRSYHGAGRAVVITTVILCSQFLLLTVSDFVPTTQFGLLTAVGLIAALIFDLLLLPALVVWSWRGQGRIVRALRQGR